MTCGGCGRVREVADPNVPGKCSHCGSSQATINPCERCGLDDLDYARAHSNAGRLFERLLELEFYAERFNIPWSEVTAEETSGLQILMEERNRYHREREKRPQSAT